MARDSTTIPLSAKRIAALFSGKSHFLVVSALISLIFYAFLRRPEVWWDEAWLGLNLLGVTLRLGLVRWFDKGGSQWSDAWLAKSETAYAILCSTTGLCWGLTPWIFLQTPEVFAVKMVMTFSYGVMLGGLTTLFPSIRTGIGFATCVILPHVAWDIAFGGWSGAPMAVAGSFFLLICVSGIRIANSLLVVQIQLAINNADLAKQLEHQILIEEQLKEQRAIALSQAQRAELGVIAGGIAHEINNPMAIIKGRAQQMRRLAGTLPSEENRNFFDKNLSLILSTVDRVAGVVQVLLKMSRSEHCTGVQKHSLRELIEETLTVSRTRLNSEGIGITLEMADDVHLQCDRQEIQHVLVNLIGNSRDAIKHLPEPAISLRAHFTFEGAFIRVSDNGPGVPEEHLPQIFDSFYTTKPMGSGTGLGLYITSRILARYQGKISYTPDPATFTIFLPVDQKSVEPTHE